MTEQALPDSDHVARYCSPQQVEEDGLPSARAFLPRKGEASLSVFWLEYFAAANLNDAIGELRSTIDEQGTLTLKRNGRFAVINIGLAKRAVRTAGGVELAVEHAPTTDAPAHAEISGINSFRLAHALRSLVTREDMYPARLEPSAAM